MRALFLIAWIAGSALASPAADETARAQAAWERTGSPRAWSLYAALTASNREIASLDEQARRVAGALAGWEPVAGRFADALARRRARIGEECAAAARERSRARERERTRLPRASARARASEAYPFP